MVQTENYQICNRCIIDSSVPGASFDNECICNFCHLQDKMETQYPNDERGQAILQKWVNKIKKSGSGRKFDCVAGISGGRDSTYSLYYIVKILGLRPLAVHFNNGFGNPTAGENMVKVCKRLGVELRTITSDWRESKDIRIAFLKASTPDTETGTDLGIATSLYGVAVKESVQYILIGQSFRTEGICPLAWNYLDGKYLKSVHKKFGTVPLRPWKPDDPGFNLGIKEMLYYTLVKRIKTVPILYYVDYIRKNVDEFLIKELEWVNPGAHWFDDLYQSLTTHVLRIKFGINRRVYCYSALVRSEQMTREEALEKSKLPYSIEDPKIIDLCIKRLGYKKEEFEEILKEKPKFFTAYPSNYRLIMKSRIPIWVMAQLNLLPKSAYDKYFNCGKY